MKLYDTGLGESFLHLQTVNVVNKFQMENHLEMVQSVILFAIAVSDTIEVVCTVCMWVTSHGTVQRKTYRICKMDEKSGCSVRNLSFSFFYSVLNGQLYSAKQRGYQWQPNKPYFPWYIGYHLSSETLLSVYLLSQPFIIITIKICQFLCQHPSLPVSSCSFPLLPFLPPSPSFTHSDLLIFLHLYEWNSKNVINHLVTCKGGIIAR